jgi:stearoyl-CoA desaturase (delta-9 desaturase)
MARKLAYFTVCIPALGFIAAILFSIRYGFTLSDLTTLAAMYLIAALGVEVGLHRFFAHHAFSAGRTVTILLGIAGTIAVQGPIIFWVATHRIHHAFADREGDPHSPRPIGTGRLATLRGLWHGHVGWLFTVRRVNWTKFVPDLIRNRHVLRIDRYYFMWIALGLVLPTAVGWALTGNSRGAVGGFLWGGLTRIFLLDQVTWGINSIGHTLGSRPYRTRDNSRNIWSFAPFSIGASWHNNHHARPSLALTRHAFWQVDIAGLFIYLLDKLRLVSNVHYARNVQQLENRKEANVTRSVSTTKAENHQA